MTHSTFPDNRIPETASVVELLDWATHWNGYRREEAILRLAGIEAPGTLPALIERLNDWVPEVRRAAKAAFYERLNPEHCSELVTALPAINRLAEYRRDDHKPLIGAVEDCLTQPACKIALIAGIRHEDRDVVRACYTLLLARLCLPPQELIQIGLAHPDPLIRLKSLKYLNTLPESSLPENIVDQALDDHFPPVRQLSLRILIQTNPIEARVEPYLLDNNRTIREIAARYLLQRSFTVSETYRLALKAPSAQKQRAALWGVAYLRMTDEIDLAIEKLGSALPSVRREALLCLTRLDQELASPFIFDLLTDPSPGVARTAVNLAHKCSIQVSLPELRQILNQSGSPAALQTCLSLALFTDKWDALAFILEQIATGSNYYDELKNAFSAWWRHHHNRSFYAPRNDQQQLLGELVAQLPDPIKGAWKSQLDCLLR